ncbi:pancreatic lipase-related protein 2-like isoform X2 [Hyperolius riggenbachi]|uniref:pancreatic lipase-related protein 2-like isoform X2 n=1 Tax=Hyperolius riggenbachi TaxID=752182 RepID=UPI0035A32195
MFLYKVVMMLIAHSLGTKEIQGAQVCYDRLGCFSDDLPWSGTKQRTLIPLPFSPEEINTTFLLRSREDPEHYQEIDAKNIESIMESSFSTQRRTVMVIHGMGDTVENNWVSNLTQEILRVEDVNAIGVDWRNGCASLWMYPQAASNVRVVGAEIAYFIKKLQEELGYPPQNLHLIGHSLGAHIGGEAGKTVDGIGRITGLDPSRPYFEGTPEIIHLDASDADFVDIIHTDTEALFGLGTIKPTGHFDFYPNGGEHMTGCPSKLAFLSDNTLTLAESVGCSHLRAPLYYIESVRKPSGFLGYPCANYQLFKDGACFPCPPGGCPTMGHYAELSQNLINPPETFYLHTGGDRLHFSSYRYKISSSLAGVREISGQVYISLSSDEVSTPEYELLNGTLLPGNTYSKFIDSGVKLDGLNCVNFRWALALLKINVFQFQLGMDHVDVQFGEDGTINLQA